MLTMDKKYCIFSWVLTIFCSTLELVKKSTIFVVHILHIVIYILEFARIAAQIFLCDFLVTISRLGMQYKQYHIPSTDHRAQCNAIQYNTMQFTISYNAISLNCTEKYDTVQYRQHHIPATDHPG